MKLYTSKTGKHTAQITGQFVERKPIDERRALVLKITRNIRTLENQIKAKQKRARQIWLEVKELRARLKGQKRGLDIALQQNETIESLKASGE